MPRASKGARLYPQPERRDRKTGEVIEHSVWVIRDGRIKRSTGVCVTDRRKAPESAEQALGEYIIGRRRPSRQKQRLASEIPVADVIAIYLKDVAPNQARPKEVAARAKSLLAYWGHKTLDEVNGPNCREFAEKHKGARRKLEDLRAAIGHFTTEGLCREIVKVVLPPKGEPRDRWLTRSEAARLIWKAWRYREVQKGHPTGRKSRQHVARFILVGIYTGTRAATICGAAFEPTPGSGWVDLERGIFFRRPKGEKETKKRKPPVRLPNRLLTHMRRWKRKRICFSHVVEWNGQPVKDIDKAFRNCVRDARLSSDVTPHVLKHTSITWSMQRGTSKEDAASFFGTTVETIERHYWHHHPDFQADAAENVASSPARQKSDRNGRNEGEQMREKESNVAGFATAS